MFSNVLVGVDGRQGGRDAIALARQLAAPGARITLAHVDPIETTDGADTSSESHRMLSDERAGAAIEARILVVHGSSVGHALHQLIATRHYDLLVVGSCHRGGVTRQVAGDHTIQSLNDARCPVAIAPQGHAAVARLSRVGVGWDGSPEAAQALQAAQAIAARTGGDDRAAIGPAQAEPPLRRADPASLVGRRQATDLGGPGSAQRYGWPRRPGQIRITRRTARLLQRARRSAVRGLAKQRTGRSPAHGKHIALPCAPGALPAARVPQKRRRAPLDC